MKRLTPLLLLIVALLLAACGGDPNPVETGSGNGDLPVADDPIPVDSDGGAGDVAEPTPAAEEQPVNEPAPIDETVITDDDAVDPRITVPSEVLVNPDDPTQLWVRFIGGDPNCTAASATLLTETPDEIAIELLVGITQDALARSCMAGEFNLRVDVSLNEPGEGKRISWTQPAGEQAPLVTPDLSTDDFVGLTEAEAAAIAEENTIPWRISRIDGEFFDLTEDFNPGRLTFQIDDGIITSAGLG